LAKPTVNTPYPIDHHAAPFMMNQYQNRLEDTVPDSAYTTRNGSTKHYVTPKPGSLRFHDATVGRGPYKNVVCHDACYFKWVLNRSGAKLEQFSFVARPASLAGQTATGGSVTTITDTGLTADELTHTLASILDDAGGTNADPEGDWGIVVENTTTRIDLQPDFSAAPVNTDTYDICKLYEIEDAADGDEGVMCQGTIVSPDGIEDDYWGWIGIWGIIGTALANEVTEWDAVVADAASVGNSGSDPTNLHVGYSLFTYQAAYTKAAIFINTMHPIADADS